MSTEKFTLTFRHHPDCAKDKMPTTTTAGNTDSCDCGMDELLRGVEFSVKEIKQLQGIINELRSEKRADE